MTVSYDRPSTFPANSRRNQMTPNAPHQYRRRSAAFSVSSTGSTPPYSRFGSSSAEGSNIAASRAFQKSSAAVIAAGTSATTRSNAASAASRSAATACT
jgi:hypothetical protein